MLHAQAAEIELEGREALEGAVVPPLAKNIRLDEGTVALGIY